MRSFPPLLPVCAHRMCGKKEEEEEDIDNSRYSCKEQGGGGRSSPEEEGSFILPLSCCEHGYTYSTVHAWRHLLLHNVPRQFFRFFIPGKSCMY